MKTKLTLLALLISTILLAQTGINYKAVIKDNSGNLVINTPVEVQFDIREDFDGLLVYSETQSTSTNGSGIVILVIGTGSPILGVFDAVFSGPNDTSLTVQVDTGAGLIDMGTTAFNSVPYAMHSRIADVAQNLTGLEFIIEDGSFGWRLIGRTAANFGTIGIQAIDLSAQPVASEFRGATGDYSFATGSGTRASGEISSSFGIETEATGFASSAFGRNTEARDSYSMAIGQNAIADGVASMSVGRNTYTFGANTFATGRETNATANYAVATGYQNNAQGLYSFATGFSTIASGDGAMSAGNNTFATGNNTFATGLDTSASGNNSVAFGYDSFASGNRSFVAGSNTNARTFSSFAIGRWNRGLFGSDDSWVGQDALFEIGIGSSANNRRNAVTVLKNGNVGIGTDLPGDMLHLAGRLRIGTESIEDTGNNQLSFGASLIPDSNNSYRLGNSSSRWIGVWAVDGTINTSDRRDKENITDLDYGLKEIMNLKPISFNWKKRPEAGVKLGLIAQDLQAIIPEVVLSEDIIYSEDNPTSFEKKPLDRLGVYYSDLVPVLIKAIQEQQKSIESLKSTVDSQQSIINNQNEITINHDQLYQALLARMERLEFEASN